ncbi:MAG: hypothetical protein UX78_C0012G0022 [Candidatus Amesbacteria bacterium GW2011_GWA2_47_11]|uniref:Uncharacterized protein n=3 Tax=Candidatus Amesiibacteriota TaxID=1752730 RepID=A0A0G1UJA8_9BACT|nr:MAG: hypothetical protein UX78_C0012G0022 [Candidatus Amesbacteria bacterium GW2011_GWA2_47_11]KKU94204.1 MAG: hypothetical protein UY22_C0015G0028 [Candidatus Amesbacteria bacterium GW2011_GWC1_48_10]KKW00506.1 MAG: hypothetical protein UY33_C0010G0027 [Candidatus Amesbacteria bacterium GW2011_GWA1_48_9]
MKFGKKQRRVWTIIVVVSTLALILGSVLPYITLSR